jgi:hypothetical protein
MQQHDFYAQVIHKLGWSDLGNMWVICGLTECQPNLSHMVDSSSFYMPKITS